MIPPPIPSVTTSQSARLLWFGQYDCAVGVVRVFIEIVFVRMRLRLHPVLGLDSCGGTGKVIEVWWWS